METVSTEKFAILRTKTEFVIAIEDKIYGPFDVKDSGKLLKVLDGEDPIKIGLYPLHSIQKRRERARVRRQKTC